jgi:hypothetical protein
MTLPEPVREALPDDVIAAIGWMPFDDDENAVLRYIATLTAERDALAQRCAAAERDAGLHRAMQRAAGELPEGWEIVIGVERGAGWVDVTDWDGNPHETCPDDSLAQQVHAAIDAAIHQETP